MDKKRTGKALDWRPRAQSGHQWTWRIAAWMDDIPPHGGTKGVEEEGKGLHPRLDHKKTTMIMMIMKHRLPLHNTFAQVY